MAKRTWRVAPYPSALLRVNGSSMGPVHEGLFVVVAVLDTGEKRTEKFRGKLSSATQIPVSSGEPPK